MSAQENLVCLRANQSLIGVRALVSKKIEVINVRYLIKQIYLIHFRIKKVFSTLKH